MKWDLCINVNTFNLKATLECGQCFRWKCINDANEKENAPEYIGVILDRVVKIKQVENKLYVASNKTENLEKVISEYLDLNKDYAALEEKISKIDLNVSSAINFSSGIRILNQPEFETYISYIISANNNIKRISNSVDKISQMYGTKVEFENNEYYLFPSLNQMKNCTVEELLRCGVGFRAKYIYHDIQRLQEEVNNTYGQDVLANIKNMTTSDAKKYLQSFMGIGPKVADCILLFSQKRGEVFPIDVWVKRIMEKLYFKQNTSIKEIQAFAQERFGEDAGIIQQHLFYNVREGVL